MVPKLNRLKVAETLKSAGLTLFTPPEFGGVFKVSLNTAAAFIKRNVKSGFFIKLRNKFYALKDAAPSPLFVANKLYEPSYISLATALSHYGIIPEVVYATTSITTMASREFTTPQGMFIYQRLKKTAFTGYGLRLIDQDRVLIAEPAKALADYLYFVDLGRISLNDRLELKNINRADLVDFVKLFKRPGLLKRVDQIYAEYKKPRKIY